MFGLDRGHVAVFLLMFANIARAVDFSPRQKANAARMNNYVKAVARQAQQPVLAADKSESSDDKIFAYPYEDYHLESNGLHVIVVPLGGDFPGIVATHITVNAGSRDELEPGKTGMAHFFEHMMFRGTR